jgi:vacuolar-type H+-ATPase subunit H
MWKTILKFVVSLFWPEIKKLLAKYAKELLAWLDDKIKHVFSARNNQNASDAQTKAEEAVKRAQTEADPLTAETLKAEAKVWQEVAEKYRRENQWLINRLSELSTEGETKVNDSLSGLAFDHAFDVSESDVKAIQNRPLLPLQNNGATTPPLHEH